VPVPIAAFYTFEITRQAMVHPIGNNTSYGPRCFYYSDAFLNHNFILSKAAVRKKCCDFAIPFFYLDKVQKKAVLLKNTFCLLKSQYYTVSVRSLTGLPPIYFRNRPFPFPFWKYLEMEKERHDNGMCGGLLDALKSTLGEIILGAARQCVRRLI
jgi:hypothetical protein